MAEEIGSLHIDMTLTNAEFKAGMTDVSNRLKIAQSEFKLAGAGLKDFGKSMDGLKAKSKYLEDTLKAQQEKVDFLKQRYEQLKSTQGENAAATQRMLVSYNNAQSAMRTTQARLNDVNEQITLQSSKWHILGEQLNQTGEKLDKVGGKISGAGKNLTAGLTAPIAGFGIAAAKIASDFDTSSGQIQAKLGITKQRAEELGKVAEDVWKNGFGENVEEAGNSVITVSQNLKVISDEELNKASKAALVLSKTFNAEVGNSTKTAASLMKNFSIDSTKAFDIMTTGFQQGGDYSGELLDTLNEYSVQFSSMGLSADQFLSILISGARNGAFNLDKVGDAVKEFNIRAQDGSKVTADGFAAIGLNAQQMGEAIAEGGDAGQKAFVATISALAAMKDPIKQNIAGTNLFGTQWEDVRKKVILAMSDATKNIQKVDGATKEASDAISDNFGSKLQTVFREFQDDFKPIGDDLLEVAKDTLPKVANSISKVTDSFANMSPEARKTVLVIGGFAAAIGPVLVISGTLVSSVGTIITTVGAASTAIAGAGGLAGALTLLTGPIGFTIAGVGLVTAAVLAFKNGSKELTDVNLDHAKSLIDQQQSLETLTGKYEKLREKNKLSNGELLLFKDIQDDIKTAGSAKEIENLTKQADYLRRKSGLSNDEFSEMLTLNDKIIKKTPSVGQAFSDQGNSIINNTKDLHEANNKLRENIQLELEIQKTKAGAKLDDNLRAQIRGYEDLNKKIIDLNNAKIEAAAKEYQLEQMKKQQQDAYAKGQDAIAKGMDTDIMRLQQELKIQNDNVDSVASKVQEKQKSLEKTEKEIKKTQNLYTEMINLQLAQAGINAKGEEGLTQLDAAITKTQKRIAELNSAKREQGGLNDAQQKELDNLNSALGTYQETKSEIKNIQTEQGTVNSKIDDGKKTAGEMSDILSASEVKDIKFSGDGYTEAKIISDEAGKDANKEISVTDYGKTHAIDSEANKGASKTISIGASISSTFTNAVKAFEKMSGINIPGFAKGTNYAPGGISLVGEQGPELMYIPRGAQIIPNYDTQRLLNSQRQTEQLNSSSSKQPTIIQIVTPDRRELARWIVDDLTEFQDFNLNRKLGFEGR
jgi:phage-related minor tail protein